MTLLVDQLPPQSIADYGDAMFGSSIHCMAINRQQPVTRYAIDVDNVAVINVIAEHGLYSLPSANVESQDIHFVNVSPFLRVTTCRLKIDFVNSVSVCENCSLMY